MLRLSAHKLSIETGRWQNILRESRLCEHCKLDKIETESYFLFECHSYSEGRKLMFGFIRNRSDIHFYIAPYYDTLSLLKTLKQLFAHGEFSSINSLGKFIFESFKKREP